MQVVLSDTRANALENFNREVSKLESIEQCHMIAGSFDYLLKVRTKNISQYRALLAEKISSLPNVASTLHLFLWKQLRINITEAYIQRHI